MASKTLRKAKTAVKRHPKTHAKAQLAKTTWTGKRVTAGYGGTKWTVSGKRVVPGTPRASVHPGRGTARAVETAAPLASSSPVSRRSESASRRPLIEALSSRISKTFRELLDKASLDLLKQAAAASTGSSSAVTLLEQLPALSPEAAVDPLVHALAHGAQAKQALLDETPTLPTADVSSLLRISPQAVRKRVDAGKLLALTVDSDLRFPAKQFDRATQEVVPGLGDFLQASQHVGPWMQLEILTRPMPQRDGATVLDLLRRGRLEEALRIVRTFGEHGA